MAIREHIEGITATIGGMAFAAWQGFVGDLVKVACVAAVSAVTGYVAKLFIERAHARVRKFLNKEKN